MTAVSIDDVAAMSAEIENVALSNTFIMNNSRDLFMKSTRFNKGVYEELVHKITRTPAELRHHVSLIIILLREKKKDALQGAILDLFIALGSKGYALRLRFLSLARPYLDEVVYIFLQKNIKNGLNAADVHPPVQHSRLSKAYDGSPKLVNRHVTHTRAKQTRLEEARECLNIGQLDLAQKILEEEILSSPVNTEVANELGDIYKHAHDLSAFRLIKTKMVDKNINLPETWQELESELDKLT